jgi:glycosyltransferase involved in cell wall biosynthesis
MLKIIQVVPDIAHEASGPSYTVVRLCESLELLGADVTLAALDRYPLTSPPSYLQTFPLGLGPQRFGHSPKMKYWLKSEAQLRRVDLIHNHSLWMMPNIYPGQIARRYHVPLVVSPRGSLSEWAFNHGSKVKKLVWPILQRPALSATACFHATAYEEYQDIRRLGFTQPVAIVPNGVDIPSIKEVSLKQKRTLLFLGRIHPKKGLDLLLPAWRAVQDRFPDWNLRIVGPNYDDHFRQMQQLAKELSVERVEFAGPLYGDEKSDAYQNADLFVLPTYSENFGMSVAEALAAGTSVIVTKGAPWSGLVKRQAGWWIDIGLDPLIAILEEAFSLSKEELDAKGQRGREWMEDEFSWSSITQQMMHTYRWILNGGTTPEWVKLD